MRSFEKRDLIVAAIDSSGAARQLLTDVIKAAGFTSVSGMTSVKDVIERLEVEEVDWVILPMGDEAENGLSFLKLCTLHPKLRSTKVTLLADEKDKELLGTAFELGLISYFDKPFTKDSLANDLGQFMGLMEQNKWNETLTSAEYLRRYLREGDLYAEWIQFEKSLQSLFPGDPQILCYLAEPLSKSGRTDEAKGALRQALLLDSSFQTKVQELTDKFFGAGATLKVGESEKENVLSIESVVIVDSDESIRNSVKAIFAELGVTAVHDFDNGETALAHIKENPNPGIIIQEWRLPKVTGPLFIQRAITEGAPATPFVVLSSLVKPEDFPLIKEMGVASLANKPLDRSAFLKNIVYTIQQERLPTEHSTKERKIRSLIKAKKKSEAQKLIEEFMAEPSVSPPQRKLIEAEWYFFVNEHEKCRDACIEVIKTSGDSIIALNLLGKSLMMLRDFSAALKCMKKAQSLSPMNIERLCAIAEAHTELGQKEEAAAAINQASDIDPDSKVVAESKVSLAMASGNTEEARKLMGKLDSLDGIVAYMNNKAVALAKCDLLEEGIDQYRKTLEALPDNAGPIKAQVLYNFALAYARSGDLEEAKITGQLALSAKPKPSLKAKIDSLVQRLKKAIESGEDFHFLELQKAAPSNVDLTAKADKSEKGESGAQEEPVFSDNDVKIAAVLAKRGDLGCFMIYKCDRNLDPRAKKLLATIPRFSVRETITRNETMGADRLLKSS